MKRSIYTDNEIKTIYLKYKNIIENGVVLFGAGKNGRRLGQYLAELGLLKAFVDNNENLQGKEIFGVPVESISSILKSKDNNLIVISTINKNSEEIKSQLNSFDLHESVDYVTTDIFEGSILPTYIFFERNQIVMKISQIVLTERCTLRCKKCAHACYAVDRNEKDLPLEEAFHSADSFFSNVDYVMEFSLLGGEPLLYKNLVDVVEYIGKKYRQKIGMFTITTNGTIIPKQDLIDVCKKNGVVFNISNYSLQIPELKRQYGKITQILENNKVEYILTKEESDWMDYGFETVLHDEDEAVLIDVFDRCKTPCHEVRDGRFYYCVMARTVSDNLKYGEGTTDYFDLKEIGQSKSKYEFLMYLLGYSEKGYLDMCRRCRGREAQDFIVPAAEQL